MAYCVYPVVYVLRIWYMYLYLFTVWQKLKLIYWLYTRCCFSWEKRWRVSYNLCILTSAGAHTINILMNNNLCRIISIQLISRFKHLNSFLISSFFSCFFILSIHQRNLIGHNTQLNEKRRKLFVKIATGWKSRQRLKKLTKHR